MPSPSRPLSRRGSLLKRRGRGIGPYACGTLVLFGRCSRSHHSSSLWPVVTRKRSWRYREGRTTTLGHPKTVLTAVFAVALIEFHIHSPRETVLLVLTWAVLIGVQPERPLYWMWRRIGPGPHNAMDLGEIVGYRTPGLFIVRDESDSAVALGTFLVCKDSWAQSDSPWRLIIQAEMRHLFSAVLNWLFQMPTPPGFGASAEDSDQIVLVGSLIVLCHPPSPATSDLATARSVSRHRR